MLSLGIAALSPTYKNRFLYMAHLGSPLDVCVKKRDHGIMVTVASLVRGQAASLRATAT